MGGSIGGLLAPATSEEIVSLRRHLHFASLGKRKEGKLPTLKRRSVICESCGREKRLDSDGRLKPHLPPGQAGTKCYGSTFRSAPVKRPATRTAKIRQRNPKRAAEQRLADFGPQAEWMRTLPCATCGAPPPSDPSHVKTRKAGGCRDDMIPACAACHEAFHAGRETFAAEHGLTLADLLDLAARYAEQWASLLPQVRTEFELLFCQRWPAAGRLFREQGYG